MRPAREHQCYLRNETKHFTDRVIRVQEHSRSGDSSLREEQTRRAPPGLWPPHQPHRMVQMLTAQADFLCLSGGGGRGEGAREHVLCFLFDMQLAASE
jgi:hypothetical protein